MGHLCVEFQTEDKAIVSDDPCTDSRVISRLSMTKASIGTHGNFRIACLARPSNRCQVLTE